MQTSLTWHGHSAFVIESSVSVLIDPFMEGNPTCTAKWQDMQPDVLLVSHGHDDHVGQTVAIAKKSKALVGAVVELAVYLAQQGVPAEQIANGCGWNIDGTLDMKGVKVTMTSATHTTTHGVPVGFVLEMPNGLTIYHAGDTGLFSDMALIGERFNIDVALLPIGGVFTMDGVQAAKACALLKAKKGVPMHYGTFPVLAQNSVEFENALKIHAPSCQALVLKSGQKAVL